MRAPEPRTGRGACRSSPSRLPRRCFTFTARRRRLGLLLGGASRRSAAVRGQRGDRRGDLLCPRLLYVRRSELKEISPDAVDVSSFDEAKQVASVAEEERRIIEAERRRLGLDV